MNTALPSSQDLNDDLHSPSSPEVSQSSAPWDTQHDHDNHTSEILIRNLKKQGIDLWRVLPRLLDNLDTTNKYPQAIKKEIRRRIFVILHRRNHGKFKKWSQAITSIFRDRIGWLSNLNAITFPEIKSVASDPFYSSFSGMQAATGQFPTQKNIDDLKSWCTENEILNTWLLSSITGMMSGKWMPTKQNIDDLKSWCTLDGTLNTWLLSSITGMMHGKWMLTKQNIDDLKEWCHGYNDLFRFITWKVEGMPSHERFKELSKGFSQKIDS